MESKIFKTDDVRKFKALIINANNIVLTCHVRPDGDAVGSTLGFAKVLQSLGKNASVVTPDQGPRSLWFLPDYKSIVAATRYPDYAAKLIEEAELIICCDFNEPKRQDDLGPLVLNATCPKVLVDHHEDPGNFTDLMFSYPKMSSTCELVFRLIAAMGWYDVMTKEAAECICTGLITDTRNFSVNCDNPEVYEILLRLLEKGVDKKRIVKEALETKSLDSVRLQAFAMCERLEIFPEHHAAIITLTKEDLARFHYERGDSEGLVNAPLQIRGMVYSFFLREDDNMIKVSARSVANFPVNKICNEIYNGGGHIMAAGGEFTEGDAETRLKRCRDLLVEIMPKYDKEIKRISPEKIETRQ